MTDKEIPKGFEYHVPDDYSITPTDRCMMALHSLREKFDIFEDYHSPIELMLGKFRMEQENDVLKAVQECGVSVDKDELVKALLYDRGQYEKGYMNGYTKAIKEFANEFEYEILHKEFWNDHPHTSQVWLNGYEQCMRDMRVMLKDKIKEMVGDDK